MRLLKVSKVSLLKIIASVFLVLSALSVLFCIFELEFSLYSYELRHSCELKDVSISKLLQKDSDISILDDFCPYCGDKVTSDNLYILKESHCLGCNKQYSTDKGKYCTECGGDIIEKEFVTIKSTGYSISTIRIFCYFVFYNILILITSFILILYVLPKSA